MAKTNVVFVPVSNMLARQLLDVPARELIDGNKKAHSVLAHAPVRPIESKEFRLLTGLGVSPCDNSSTNAYAIYVVRFPEGKRDVFVHHRGAVPNVVVGGSGVLRVGTLVDSKGKPIVESDGVDPKRVSVAWDKDGKGKAITHNLFCGFGITIQNGQAFSVEATGGPLYAAVICPPSFVGEGEGMLALRDAKAL
jgi:hypothetical protein